GRAFAPPSLNSITCDMSGSVRRGVPFSTSVLDGHAVDVIFLEIFASGFRFVLIEPGKARAIVGRAALIDRFGEGFCTREDFRSFALDAGEALLGRLLGGVGANLDHPARTVLRLRRRRGCFCGWRR